MRPASTHAPTPRTSGPRRDPSSARMGHPCRHLVRGPSESASAAGCMVPR